MRPQVPIALYFMTHAYFCFYHALANVCLRRVTNAVPEGPGRLLALGTVVFVLSYATAFMETLTISHFPYYTFKARPCSGCCRLKVVDCPGLFTCAGAFAQPLGLLHDHPGCACCLGLRYIKVLRQQLTCFTFCIAEQGGHVLGGIPVLRHLLLRQLPHVLPHGGAAAAKVDRVPGRD